MTIIITGRTAEGKTTTAKSIQKFLEEKGYSVGVLVDELQASTIKIDSVTHGCALLGVYKPNAI